MQDIVRKRILLYTFFRWSRSTYKALRSIDSDLIEKYYINGKRFDPFLHKIEIGDYRYVIGFADYRVNARNIRIESRFINNYGGKKILENPVDYHNATVDLPTEHIVYHKDNSPVSYYRPTSTTNSSCNKSGFLALNRIASSGSKTRFAFVHIPRSIPVIQISQLYDYWVKSLVIL